MPFMAAAAPFIALAGGAMTAVSSVVSGLQQAAGARASGELQKQGYEAQANAARYNAQVAEMAAQNTEKAGAYEVSKEQRRGDKLIGSQEAGYGAAGVTAEGSPLEVMASTAHDITMDELTTKYNYSVEASRQRSQAGMFGYEAARDTSMGSNIANVQESMAPSMVARGFMGAGTALLTTAGSIYGKTGARGYGYQV